MKQLSGLFIYPIKSLGGISLTSAKVTDRGLEHDRRWMLVDQNNRFISQRELPQMALCKPALLPDSLQVTYQPTGETLLIPYQPQTNEFAGVTVWDDTCRGQFVNTGADAWFSRILGIDCRLVYMPDDSLRPVDPKYADADKITSFSDAYPFLIIGQASMDDLSNRTSEVIPINRFRPNLVFTGGDAFLEDEMAHFVINNIHFYGVKLCARCPIPGINQETALRVKEPLKALNGYRRKNNKVWMGQNLVHEGLGVLTVGDVIEVLEVKEAAVFD
ncbi:MOSC N-terminal beta barrel domain-containing protein [Mucilaginibacter mali]|uniref:MOSC N-terminal beta barrel domain-containing protein n=1 Tax=Mucilaginibacter mali TaxID=2740462 RepID=A0A7D4TY07_9SPHI|nr:MOSC N-terminal beta barrel domain-containing protein [Mucilaginibacter mali]QKJ30877.1 MOSC N-terminal beta barrel domain-containing protein [Mucilaginibacter mali]